MRHRAILALVAATGLHAQAIRQNPGFKTYKVARNDDGSSASTQLGFNLNFFGRTRSSGYVNNNGNITFDSPLSTYTPFGLESTRREIVAAFFADVDTRPAQSELVTYGQDLVDGRPAFGANYINVGYYNQRSDKLNSFQIVLIDRSDTGEGNFDIEFNYERISWETGEASGGTAGFGGVSASVGWSNGSGQPGTSYELEGSLIPGSFLNAGRYSLVRNRLNSPLRGRFVFRGRGGRVLPPLGIVSSCPLPSGSVAQPYAAELSAVGGSGTYQWSMTPDPGASLPPGLALNASGMLTGTPSTPGSYEFMLNVTSRTEDGLQTDSKRCTIAIEPPVLTISSPCPLPAATVGQPYSRTLAVSGGRAPYRWTLADGSAALPAGLALSSSGAVAGVPTAAGTTIVQLRVTSNEADGSQPGTKLCAITVQPSVTPLTGSCSLPSATVGVPYSQELATSGGTEPYVWSATGNLPAGLSLASDGRLTGVPTSAGGATFRARARDARGMTTEQSCSLRVQEPAIGIETRGVLPAAETGREYSYRFSASGGTGPYSWSAVSGLPAGLTLSGDGELSGIPAAAGPFAFRVMATDAEGRATTQGFNLLVGRSAFSIPSCPLPNASVGVDYGYRVSAQGGVAPYYYTAASVLPDGLTVSATGYVSGRAREAGAFPVRIRVMDSAGNSTVQPCPVTVLPSVVQIGTECPLPRAAVGAPYLQRLEATGGTSPYRFRFDGAVPVGLELTSDGTLRGTPVAAGVHNFEIEVTDSQNRSVSKACSVEIGLPSMPSLRLSSVAATVQAATAGPTITVELSGTYSLPVQGEIVLTVEPDTGASDGVIDRPDPAVRFTNGQQVFPFTIAAGARQASVQIASTGTVASNVIVSLANVRVAGTILASLPSPRQFRILRSAPVLTDACYVPTSWGFDAVVTGYTTTRKLSSAGVVDGSGIETAIDVTPVARDYFSTDASVRGGGTFTMTIPFDRQEAPIGNLTIWVSNSAGKSASRAMPRCRQ